MEHRETFLAPLSSGHEGGGLSAVFLGGGSGAELLAFVHCIIFESRTSSRFDTHGENSEKVDSVNNNHGDGDGEEVEGRQWKKAKVSPPAARSLTIHVVDYAESWAPVVNSYSQAIKSLWSTALQAAGLSVDVVFRQADLLRLEDVEAVSSLCSSADYVTLLYTITELLDKDTPATALLFERLFRALKPHALLVVADPVSNEICRDKTSFVDTISSRFLHLESLDVLERKISWVFPAFIEKTL